MTHSEASALTISAQSSFSNMFWTPAFAGVTGFWTFYWFINIDGFVKSKKISRKGAAVLGLRYVSGETTTPQAVTEKA